jgi:hypothetical protein
MTCRGYPADHAAAQYLKHRQFYAGRSFRCRRAQQGLYPTCLRRSRLCAARPLPQRAAYRWSDLQVGVFARLAARATWGSKGRSRAG